MSLSREAESRRLAQIERRLNELGSMVRGNQSFQADRIADVMEQISELQEQLIALSGRVDRIAAYLTELRAEKRNGET